MATTLAQVEGGGSGGGGGGGGDQTQASTMLRGGSDRRSYYRLLAVNYVALFVGTLASTLLSRFYFVHRGSKLWVATLVQSAGFPLLLVPIYLAPSSSPPFSRFTPRLFALCVFLGLLLGINNLLISCGQAYLPVSTNSLILSSQLAFILVLTSLLLRRPLTFSNLNCVVLLTLASILLAIGSNSDRPAGVSRGQFFLGFASTLGAAGLFAAYLPIMELVYRKVDGYRMVMEVQVVMEAAAAALAATGVAAGGRWSVEKRWDLGKAGYWVTIAATVVSWQLCFMGTAGMVFLTSSLNSGICMTALLAVNVVGGVVAFGDMFGGQKAVALALCLWGFSSYLCGEYNKKKKEEESEEREVVVVVVEEGDKERLGGGE
ncbi:probable purine permease 4 [Elaeis guineensis]|uniref:Probable purine permease n=1 Tax=Elaeis guineensis var. tenera TaxID=51953 RepID=A0A6I9R724_ELAGV|nr:probable purine permease 4 [Elaeis guineensis]